MLPFSDLCSQTTDFNPLDSKMERKEVPKNLLRKFRRDAARLALRLEAQKEDIRYAGIVIPEGTTNLILSMLQRIYLTQESAQAIAKCNVHTFPNPSIDQMVVVYNREINWAAPLRAGITETTNSLINELLDNHNLIIEKHVNWNEAHDALTIRSRSPLNMAALASQFLEIEGIVNVDLSIPKVAGNDISLQRIQTGWELKYTLRFGAHTGKQGKKHIWTYHYLDNGTVKFVEESGSPIPAWMKCEKNDKLLVGRG